MVQMIEVVSSKGYEHLDEEDERKDEKKRRMNRDNNKDKDVKVNEKEVKVDAREKYKGNLFLVLEYVSHDLSGILDMGHRFTPVQSKYIFRQLLSVLDYMHKRNYVHRDLKSSNILLDSRFRVKLADFGLARCMDES